MDVDRNEVAGSGITCRVTLSGLLNAIDGIAAPEGHILIMTTNKPHELDDALVRAGRISVRVEFKNASKAQAEEIFFRMYVSNDAREDREKGSKEGEKSTALRVLAKQFAARIQDHEFSPADLQEYLLVRKNDAAAAVAELTT